DLVGTVRRLDFGGRIEQRRFDLGGAPHTADAAQVRPHRRADAVEAMALRAATLAHEDAAAALLAAGLDAIRCAAHRAHVRDDAQRLLLRHAGRRHRRVRDAVDDDARDLVVRERTAVLSAAEVDTGDQVAVRAVATRTGALVTTAAVLDVVSRLVLRMRSR